VAVGGGQQGGDRGSVGGGDSGWVVSVGRRAKELTEVLERTNSRRNTLQDLELQ